jgi:hypothetical protein
MMFPGTIRYFLDEAGGKGEIESAVGARAAISTISSGLH